MIGQGGRRDGLAATARRAAGRRAPVHVSSLAAIVALAALPGCSPLLDVSPPWAPSSARAIEVNSLTARRVTEGVAEVPVEPLAPEPGDIWPAAEAPRATLMNPDEALRVPPPAAAPPRPEEGRPPPARGRVRGSSTPPSPPPPPRAEIRVPAQPPSLPVTSPPARADGRVIPHPGGNVVTSGGTERYQTFNPPGTAGGGIAFPDGPVITLIDPDGRVRVVPAPR